MQKISKGDFKIVIPARWKSSRFPGKPLALILGKTLIERVYEACCKAVISEKVIVATDSKKIKDFCIKKKINFIMTTKNCLTGTDRIIEVSKKINVKIFINVQGDEPLINPNELKKFIVTSLKNPKQIYIAKCKIDKIGYFNKNLPKIVTDHDGNLLYISRANIPSNKLHKFKKSFGQVNIYSYPRAVLKKKIKNNKLFNEQIEDIEILRFLERGINVKVILMKKSTHAVDVKSDLKTIRSILLKKKIND
jgi:3-deoxy-manno-octulosonate cytidylyltransferase (CMP-KDO synthetase)